MQDSSAQNEQEFWIHHHKTEASEALFGFRTTRERGLFRSLIRVSGIGGKTALGMLAIGEEALLQAIQLEDDAKLSSIPGIGKKTAQKIIVELKGSIDFSRPTSSEVAPSKTDATLISSLVSMGYDKARVEQTVSQISRDLTLQERTVEAIRKLSQ